MTTVSSPRLLLRYREEIKPQLLEHYKYANSMKVPGLDKVVVNIGMGEALTSANSLDRAAEDISSITGQKPVITRAKRSIANFRLREGSPIGLFVTLRGNRMYEFLDRLISAALPSIRDFRGLDPDAFDGRGNYSIGIREQLIFPEIEFDRIDRVRGLQVTIVTTAKTDDEGRRLLELCGMPFVKN